MDLGLRQYRWRHGLVTAVACLFIVKTPFSTLAGDDGNTLHPGRWLQRNGLAEMSTDDALTFELHALERCLFRAAEVAFASLMEEANVDSQQAEERTDQGVFPILLQRVTDRVATIRRLEAQQDSRNPHYTQLIAPLEHWLTDQQDGDDGSDTPAIPRVATPSSLRWQLIAAYAHFDILNDSQRANPEDH